MQNLYTHKDSNIRKTWLLIIVFLALVIAVGFILSYVFQEPVILYIAIALSLVMNGFAYWNSDKVALSLSGAKPASAEHLISLHRLVENLAITAGLPKPRIYIIPGDQINAFATGRDPKHSAIAVTLGALQKLDKNELEGVLAHELAHIGNRDILISSVAVVLAGLIAIVSDIFLRVSIRSSFGDNDSRGNVVFLALSVVGIILAPIAATLIQLAISRKREFLADATGVLLTRYPQGLASALEKISHDQGQLLKTNNATAHLYIANPFKGKKSRGWLARLFATHPPVEERIAALRGLKL
ncbi:MAG: zinc metalloprotease HtpX [Candidatus Yanofskybacteria bacterium CG10_big_fil_rev_8_21_14_0_10_46_23]|uniref:Protease HtpX homolog n=1 Tax=Candidatus Yanofskybacteria bacterium CG10_big_fil_rev_8_21_14_0_10_46_23 TaxID=1975098 RepID=A0A2H0R6Y8_9BACT|nr:MAG: zinc metalloprotease HtpX [Candidatus Yanofskybacteria bacterium CG10_big_fil_rev_8_21_14_0_10_46_23]